MALLFSLLICPPGSQLLFRVLGFYEPMSSLLNPKVKHAGKITVF